MAEDRFYGVALDAASGVYLAMEKYSDPGRYAASGDWTPASGDVKISKDGAANANIATLPVYDADARAWYFTLSATELECKQAIVTIIDQDGPAVNDNGFVVRTFGHASSLYPDGTPNVNVVQISGDSTAADNLEADYDGTGYSKANSATGLRANALTADALASSAVLEIRAGLSSPSGVAQAGGSTSITLASADTAATDEYVGAVALLVAGAGAVQARRITANNGTTKVVTVAPAWSVTNPDTTTHYVIIGK